MNLITPFDLVEMFPTGQSVVIVGNAPSSRGAGLGAWIDSHDIVVRFNECALNDYARDLGSRTDILVTNPYPEARTRPLLDGKSCRLVLVINPTTRRGEKEVFARYVGTLPVLFTYTPDIRYARTGSLTTGTYATGLLPSLLLPSAVSITGFTCFLDNTAHHYWSDVTPPGAAKHDHADDARALIGAINRIGPKATVTAEIAWVARRLSLQLHERTKVKPLPDPRWSCS